MSNLLSVEQWRSILGFNPWHFFGLANAIVPVTSACNDIVTQYNWQNVDGVGRHAIREAIETAETRLREQLGYSVAPHYVEETVPYPRYENKQFDRLNNSGPDGRWLSQNMREGYIQSIGVETFTPIETVVLTYLDTDGDGLSDTFTATTVATTTETNAQNLGLYMSGIYRLNTDGVGEDYRIVPTKITINPNGTITVSGRAWQMVPPILYQSAANLPSAALDPSTPANFMTTADVYRHYIDPTGQSLATCQAVLTWETSPYPDWAYCCGSVPTYGVNGDDPAAVAQGIARVGIRDGERGIIHGAYSFYNATSGAWTQVASCCAPRVPDTMLVRYSAGFPLDSDGQMAKKWRTVVARLAAAELANRLCACDAANRELYKWQFDLSRAAGANDEQYRISDDDLNNPLGVQRGQVYAWKVISDERILQGFPM